MIDRLVFVVGLAGLGLLIGPFLGVIVDRAVERLPLAPEQRCTHCKAGLGIRSLRIARWCQYCWSCHRHKGSRYLWVDLATGIGFATLGLRFGTDWRLVPYLGLVAVLVVLLVIDIETHLLPNVVVWPSIWISLFLVLVLTGELESGHGIYAALAGGATFGGFIGVAHLVSERGMGRGDVKLSLLLGLFVGWLQPDTLIAVRLVLYTILIALLGGGLSGLAYNTIRRRGRAEIPFGPALASAAVVIILVSPQLVLTS